MVCNLLKNDGDLKTDEFFPTGQKPISFELAALKNAIKTKVEQFGNNCGINYEKCLVGIKPKISNYNIYGRIVFKRAKGCSYFYKLLCVNNKSDGWENPCKSMEIDLKNVDQNYTFERNEFFNNIKLIMSLKYFNRIKQFMMRLFRNNLFLASKSTNKMQNTILKSYACGNHPESRTKLMLNCPRTCLLYTSPSPRD